jgi:hypothetical protein
MADTVTVRLKGSVWRQPSGALVLLVAKKRTNRRLVLPWIPDEIERAGFARVWEQVPRPGRDPLAYDTGGSLPTHTFTVRLNSPDLDQPVSPLLGELETAAAKGRTVTATLGPRVLGLVKITGLAVREVDHDAAGNATDAVAEIELTADAQAPKAVGPVPRLRAHGSVRDAARRR